MHDQTIANISVLESLQNAANQSMDCGDKGVFNNSEGVENGSGGLHHLGRKLDAVAKQLQKEEPLSEEREKKALQAADLAIRFAERKHLGKKRAKASGYPIRENTGGSATIKDCFTTDHDLDDF